MVRPRCVIQRRFRQRRGFTILELLVITLAFMGALGMLLPALAGSRHRCCTLLKDSSQLRGIHQSWLVFSREFEGVFPTPGLINRQPDPIAGKSMERGAENKLLNDTASLHSACIMQNYYTPELAVGPTEPSGRVSIKDDYNWEMYNITGIGANRYTFWDTTMQADVANSSNTSYANMPIAGERERIEWRESLNGNWAVIGNRGVRDGDSTGLALNQSITPQIHAKKSWLGNICYNDNHVKPENSFTPSGVTCLINGQSVPDNLYQNQNNGWPSSESPDGLDCWLVVCRKMIGTPDRVMFIQASWD
jgi:hypothetical protein